jgi:PAS domain S-box-containing protein
VTAGRRPPDLTQLERAKAELAESEARFRLLAQVAPVGIVQMDAGGHCTYANDRFCALTGTTAAGALGADWTETLHPGDVDRVVEEWARAGEHGAELRTDCRLRPASGGEIWVHVAAMPLPGSGPDPLGYLAAVTNISDRKRSEAEREGLLAAERRARRSLAGQTERLNSLLATAIPGVFIADEHGLITQLNHSFCDLFGIADKPGQLIGTPAARLVRRIKPTFADPADFARRTKQALIKRQPVRGDEIKCADGRTFACDYWPVTVDGEHRGDLLLMWDVSERKALEEQRERMLTAEFAAREMAELAQERLGEQNVRLSQLDEAKTQFLATVSHELRTPLTSIVSFVELIRESDDELTPDTAGSLDVIQRNVYRLLRLVGDLLLLSRIEAGSMPLELAPVSIPDLVAEVARSGSPGAAKQGVRIDVSAEDGPPVRADQTRLQQVFDNLVANAVKFTNPGGRVRLAATHDDQAWRVDVEDSGIGIPAGELDHIFDRFVRASNARTASLPGTGLGLSVVKAITELHGGRVEADSAVGRGTTFRVYLPVSA